MTVQKFRDGGAPSGLFGKRRPVLTRPTAPMGPLPFMPAGGRFGLKGPAGTGYQEFSVGQGDVIRVPYQTVDGQRRYYLPEAGLGSVGGERFSISPEFWRTGTPYTYSKRVMTSPGTGGRGTPATYGLQERQGRWFTGDPITGRVKWVPGTGGGVFKDFLSPVKGMLETLKEAAPVLAIPVSGGLAATYLPALLGAGAGGGAGAAGLTAAEAGITGAMPFAAGATGTTGLTAAEMAGLTAAESGITGAMPFATAAGAASPWAAMTPEAMAVLSPATSTGALGGALEALRAGDIGSAIKTGGTAVLDWVKKNPAAALTLASGLSKIVSGPQTYDLTGALGGTRGGAAGLPPLRLPPLSRQLQPFTGDITQYGKPGGEAMFKFFAHGGPLSLPSRYLRGIGGGQDDLIDAKVSDGEYVLDASTVSDIGDGSNDEGARKLNTMVQQIRKQKRGGALALPPKARSPLSYLGRR